MKSTCPTLTFNLSYLRALCHPSKKSKYQTEPRSCMVLRLKPMGKLATTKKYLSTRQNQGLAWSSDSNLWGNQLPPRKNLSTRQNQGLAQSSDSNLWGNQLLSKEKPKYQTELRSCMVLGLKPVGKLVTSKRKTEVLDRTKALHESEK